MNVTLQPEIQPKTQSEVQPDLRTAPQKGLGRMFYLDHLRVFLTALVILHHTSIMYGGQGAWPMHDDDGSGVTGIILSIFTVVNQAFFMSLFFFLSGYFTPGSYDRKGAAWFLKDRLVRLGLPLLAYLFLLGPLVMYLAQFQQKMSFGAFYASRIATFKMITFGPLWFVETLIYFAVLYVLWRKFVPSRKREEGRKVGLPSSKTLTWVALALGAVAFFVRLVSPTGFDIWGLQFGYFPSYILMYICGIIAYRNRWLEQITDAFAKRWLRVAWVAIPIFPIGLVLTGALQGHMEVAGGLNLQALLYAMWEPFVCFGLSLGLIAWFRRRFPASTPLRKAMGETAYTVYVIHAVFIVVFGLLFLGVPWPSFLKFVIVGPLVIVVTFAVGYVIRKFPMAKRVL